MTRRSTEEEFIANSRKVHGDKYDYSHVQYKNSKVKVKIICPMHGLFEQMPNSHLMGNGCKKCADAVCGNDRRLSTEDFIRRSSIVHSGKYSYYRTKYTNRRTKVSIICPIHGEFQQNAGDHLQGKGCLLCANNTIRDSKRLSKQSFITKATDVHNQYDYSEVEYIDRTTRVTIICPIHGKFSQTPKSHLSGSGCPTCGVVKRSGKDNCNYKDGKSQERGNKRKTPKYNKWLREVKEGKEYCDCCGTKFMEGNKPIAHHLNAYYSFPEQRSNPSNGVCICEECHMEFHGIYNRGNNTKEQYQLFKDMKNLMPIMRYN